MRLFKQLCLRYVFPIDEMIKKEEKKRKSDKKEEIYSGQPDLPHHIPKPTPPCPASFKDVGGLGTF